MIRVAAALKRLIEDEKFWEVERAVYAPDMAALLTGVNQASVQELLEELRPYLALDDLPMEATAEAGVYDTLPELVRDVADEAPRLHLEPAARSAAKQSLTTPAPVFLDCHSPECQNPLSGDFEAIVRNPGPGGPHS